MPVGVGRYVVVFSPGVILYILLSSEIASTTPRTQEHSSDTSIFESSEGGREWHLSSRCQRKGSGVGDVRFGWNPGNV